MPGPLLKRRCVLGGAEEATSGTLETISAALASTTVYDAELQIDDPFTDGERSPDGLYLGHADRVKGKTTCTLKFKQELRHGDKFVAMLTGAGFLLATGVYKPTSSMGSRKTWSFALWEDGRRKRMSGAAGNFTIKADVGGKVMAEWEWKGVWEGADDNALPATSPINTVPYVATNLTLTLGGSALPLSSGFEIGMNNVLEPREDLTDASGVFVFIVGARAPMMSIDPEAALVATHDAYGLLLAGTTGAVNLVLTCAAGTLTIGAPRAQRLKITTGARGAKATDAIELQLNHSSGDDEISFTQST